MTRSINMYVYYDKNECIRNDGIDINLSNITFLYINKIYRKFEIHYCKTLLFIIFLVSFIQLLFSNHNDILLDYLYLIIFIVSFIYIFIFLCYIFYIKFMNNMYLYNIIYKKCSNIKKSDKIYIIGSRKCKHIVYHIAEKFCKEDMDVNFKFF